MISVGIIEDIPEIRNSLKDFFSLQKNILCEVAAESVEEFLKICDEDKEIKPDVILLDIELPGISGIGGMPQIMEMFPDADIIMLTVYEDNDKIFRSLQAGATGYLIKSTPFEQIKTAIEEIYAGGSPMSPSIARKVIRYFSPKKKYSPPDVLTNKEKEIINYLVDGKSYAAIAKTLGNSIETIRYHIKNIYRKLQVNSKAELISKNYKRKF